MLLPPFSEVTGIYRYILKIGDRITLSSTVKIKYKQTSKVVPLIVNRIYSFSKHCTWNDVLNDLTADGDHDIVKLDEVTVTASDKLANGVTFEPDFEVFNVWFTTLIRN